MGVYIKDMEMPTSCATCKLFGEYGCPFIGAVGYALSRGERSEDCPLVPVQPHGRLIDADEFLKRAIGTKCFRGDYALLLEELVGESTTIIPAEEGKT